MGLPYAGLVQMPFASRLALAGGRKGSSGRRRRRKKTSAKKGKRARTSKRKSKMKFGSPAWQKKYKVGKFAKKKR